MRPAMWGRFMGPGFFKPLLVAAFVTVLAAGAAEARAARPPEPALWEMSAGKSRVYLFGSIHMLPRDWPWRTKAIDAAILSSNVFVFEVAMTQDQKNKMSLFVQDHGKLPRGQALSRMLSPRGLKDFEKALARTPLDRKTVDTMRPWLASVVLADFQIQNGPRRPFAEEGVDYTIEQEAWERRKTIRHLETTESQLEMLMQAMPDSDIAGFEAGLHELPKADETYRRLLDGWTVGDQAALAKVMASDAFNSRRKAPAAGQAQPQLAAADRKHDGVEEDDLRHRGRGAPRRVPEACSTCSACGAGTCSGSRPGRPRRPRPARPANRRRPPRSAQARPRSGADPARTDPIKICRFLYVLLAREGLGCYEG